MRLDIFYVALKTENKGALLRKEKNDNMGTKKLLEDEIMSAAF